MRILDSIKNLFTGSEPAAVVGNIGRNEPCHCGSGLKYKRCCHDKDKAIISRNLPCCTTSK